MLKPTNLSDHLKIIKCSWCEDNYIISSVQESQKGTKKKQNFKNYLKKLQSQKLELEIIMMTHFV